MSTAYMNFSTLFAVCSRFSCFKSISLKSKLNKIANYKQSDFLHR